MSTQPSPTDVIDEALARSVAYITAAQSAEGSWKGDYGGPQFLLPMAVGATWAAGVPLDAATRSGMAQSLRAGQNTDGGWGLHVEGPSMVFTSVLTYVALRLLGEATDAPQMCKARRWIRERGGPLASASWGKFFLAPLGLYAWEGLSPVPPEAWLLPYAAPLHPARMWCHARMVYLPMSWLYGTRSTVPITPLVEALRDELYPDPWSRIDWRANRYTVAKEDDITPVSARYKAASAALDAYELLPVRRKAANDFVLDQIRREDENTDYICIGPVNKVYHLMVWAFANPGGPELARHVKRLPDYLWHSDKGITMQGYNSSELWDTAFMAHALMAAEAPQGVLRDTFRFIEGNQVLEDVPDREACFREPSKGGWPFSTRAHGWPITDCTAEGMEAALALAPLVSDPISEARLTDAADLLLYWQNADGGWASYERTRGSSWLEAMNPSNCFREIMIDYSYVECSAASMSGLVAYREHFPGRRDDQIATALELGQGFLLEQQRADGSWYGSWGICFTYGTWFGIRGLIASGLGPEHPAIQRACDFLEGKQLPDGGWGELPESSLEQRYVSTDSGQAVMTSWALMALVAAGRRDTPAAQRAIAFLLGRQRPDGSWPPEHIAGMFNKSCAIHYDNYLKIFPTWALATAR